METRRPGGDVEASELGPLDVRHGGATAARGPAWLASWLRLNDDVLLYEIDFCWIFWVSGGEGPEKEKPLETVLPP